MACYRNNFTFVHEFIISVFCSILSSPATCFDTQPEEDSVMSHLAEVASTRERLPQVRDSSKSEMDGRTKHVATQGLVDTGW